MIILNLKTILAQKGMSQYRLAKEMQVKQQFISRLANEEPTRINADTLNKICKVLDVQPGDLLEYRPD